MEEQQRQPLDLLVEFGTGDFAMTQGRHNFPARALVLEARDSPTIATTEENLSALGVNQNNINQIQVAGLSAPTFSHRKQTPANSGP